MLNALVLLAQSQPQLPFQDPSQVIALFSGLIIPLLVGLLAKLDATAGVKSVLLLALTALSQVINTAWAADVGWQWQLFLWNFMVAFLMAVGSYFGFYRGTGVTATIQAKTAGFGVGSPPTMQTDEQPLEDAA